MIRRHPNQPTDTLTCYMTTIKISIFFFLLTCTGVKANVIIVDSTHYSEVLGEYRHYRIFLPSDYHENTQKEYPAIYFYHGWSERYFGSLKRENNSSGKISKEEKDMIEMVEKYSVIVIQPDGYNAEPDDPYYLRPYNIGPVETYRQFPLYFPELIQFIDENYKTIPDRQNRAIAGFSMGGFMAYWLAGKYPDLISAAGSFCGSPEFVVGPKNFPIEYYHGNMQENYGGVRLRLNYGEEDFIRAYQKDLIKIFKNTLKDFEYESYPGGHGRVGMDDMFDFFARSFKNPLDMPKEWNHIDVYPDFEVWDYLVSTNRNVPGFTILKNVGINGFRSSIRSFLPDGETMNRFGLEILTAPVYEPNMDYVLKIYDYSIGILTNKIIRSDRAGRLKIALHGGVHEVGIFKSGEKVAKPVIHSVLVNPEQGVASEKINTLKIRWLNKGNVNLINARVKISTFSEEVEIISYEKKLKDLLSDEPNPKLATVTFKVIDPDASVVKFDVTITGGEGQHWDRSILVSVLSDKNLNKPFEIADGRKFTYLAHGVDTVTSIIGNGNGDGQLNPGETFAIMVKDQGIFRLTQLYSLSSYLNLDNSASRKSDSWSPFDHVGASFKYSIPTVSSDIPIGTDLDLFVEYWIPKYPDHVILKNITTLSVSGKDETPPYVDHVWVKDNNTLAAKLVDGGKIESIHVRIISSDEPELIIRDQLNDKGVLGDGVKGDGVYSKKVKVPIFGSYYVELKVMDRYGNLQVTQVPDSVIFYGRRLYND